MVTDRGAHGQVDEQLRERIDDPALLADDSVLLLLVASRMATDWVVRRLADEGFGDAKEGDGYVFQRLQLGPAPVGELAQHLGVTQQGASKAVADLERRGYVWREQDPHDARVRIVALSERGWAVIRAARAARAELGTSFEELLGPTRALRFRRALADVATDLGGFDAMARRNVPSPDAHR
jgi:DNA-binding MarR family transcriptional regulator